MKKSQRFTRFFNIEYLHECWNLALFFTIFFYYLQWIKSLAYPVISLVSSIFSTAVSKKNTSKCMSDCISRCYCLAGMNVQGHVGGERHVSDNSQTQISLLDWRFARQQIGILCILRALLLGFSTVTGIQVWVINVCL